MTVEKLQYFSKFQNPRELTFDSSLYPNPRLYNLAIHYFNSKKKKNKLNVIHLPIKLQSVTQSLFY